MQLTLQTLIDQSSRFRETNGFQPAFYLNKDLIEHCCQEPSFVEAYSEHTLKQVNTLTIDELYYTAKLFDLDIKLNPYER